MIEVIDLPCGSSVSLPFATLTRSAGGGVAVTGALSSCITDVELADADGLVVAFGAGALLAVGEESHALLGLDAASGALRILGTLARLELAGYDPGGLCRVLMHPVDEDRLLIETEAGFALVDLAQGVLWSCVHNDLTARVERVADGVVHVVSQGAAERYSLADGSHLGGEPRG